MIDIVLSADEAYARYGAVVMASTIAHSRNPEQLRFYCLTPGFSDQTREGLTALVEKGKALLNIIEVDKSSISDLELGRFGAASLLRLYMHRYLPVDCRRVIYLDCDVLVLGDLAELWAVPLEGYAIGAVMDLCGSKGARSRGSVEWYFNSGVLLVDMKRWHEKAIADRALTYIKENDSRLKYPDQDALNHVLAGDWLRLPSEWNFQPTAYAALEKDYRHLRTYRDELKVAIRAPRVVHFIGAIKPWHPFCTHPLQELFIQYSHQTPWPIEASGLGGNAPLAKRLRFAMKIPKIQRRRRMTKI